MEIDKQNEIMVKKAEIFDLEEQFRALNDSANRLLKQIEEKRGELQKLIQG